MDIRYLKTLLAVADHGTFAAAANAVGLSPSAISMQMRALEQRLATRIFDRSHRPPVLNEKGLAILPTARKIISLHDNLRDAAALTNEYAGNLRIGVIPTALSSFVPAALAGLNAAHPQIEIEIVTGMNTPVFTLLRTEEVDAGIIGEPPRLPSDLYWMPFTCEDICVIAPADAPETNADDLLRAYPYIRLMRSPWQLRMIDDQIAKKAISLRTIMQLDSIESVTLMVYHGLGVSIVPQRRTETLLQLPLKRLPFGTPPLTRTLGLVYHHGSPKQHLAKALFEQLTLVCNDSIQAPAMFQLPESPLRGSQA